MNHKFWCMIAIMFMGLSAPCAAQIYKWTDSNGKTVFGDKPPATTGKTASTVNTTPQPQDSTPRNTDWAEKERELRMRMAQRQASAIASAPAARNPSLMSCGEAKASQRELDRINGRHAYRRDANGERVWVTDEERANIQNRTKESLENNCQ